MHKQLFAYLKSEKLLVYLSMAFAFLLPFAHLLVIVITLIVFASIFQVNSTVQPLNASQKVLLYAILFFYVLHLAGLIYTQNSSSGWFDVKTKVVFVLFAFIYAFTPFKRDAVKSIMDAFIAGLCLASLCCLANAAYIYLTEERNTFFYQDFAIFLHPTYFALYLNFAVAWIISQLIYKPMLINRTRKRMLLFVVFLFSCIIILLSSKLGLITLFLSYLFLPLYAIFNRKLYVIGVTSLLVLIASIALIVQLPYVKTRLTNAKEAVQNQKYTDKKGFESTEVRLLIWQAANKIIARHFWLGVGTGDTKDKLLEMYQEEGMTGAYAHNLNTHNQFYQEFIALGIFGFIALLGLMLVPLGQGIRNGNSILAILALLLIINFLAEAMLETQAGASFCAFFIAVLGFRRTSETAASANL